MEGVVWGPLGRGAEEEERGDLPPLLFGGAAGCAPGPNSELLLRTALGPQGAGQD